MQEAAQLVRIFLNELELVSFLKTSGGKGLHVVVPIKRLRDWDTVKDFSQAIVEHLAKAIPPRFVSKSGPSNRVGRIFIDYLRNGLGATTASAWSARARPGLGVSVPLAWEELEALTSGDRWNASNIQDRLDIGNGPWADYEASRRSDIAGNENIGIQAGRLKPKPRFRRHIAVNDFVSMWSEDSATQMFIGTISKSIPMYLVKNSYEKLMLRRIALLRL